MNDLQSRFLRKLRSAIFIGTLILFICATVSLLWLNAIGMPQSWRNALEKKIAEQDYHVSIGHITYIPWIGVKMKDIRVFSSSQRDEEIANLKQLIFDFDKTKAMRGIHRLTKIELGNTDLLIPTTSPEGKKDILTIKDLSGKILLNRNNKVEISRIEGKFAGIKIILNGNIDSWGKSSTTKTTTPKDYQLRERLHQFVTETSRWEWSPSAAPELRLDLDADMEKFSTMKAKVAFSAPKLKRGSMELKEISLRGKIESGQMTVEKFSASDSRGRLEATFNLDFLTLSGKFLATSSIDVLGIARGLSPQPLIPEIALVSPQQLQVDGFYDFSQEQMQIRATGHASCKALQFRNHVFDDFKLDFSVNNNDFFLRDVELHHAQGHLNLAVMKKGQALQARSRGAIPLDVLRPFLNHKVITPALENLITTGLTKCHANIDAHANLQDGFKLDALTVSDVDLLHAQGWLKGQVTLRGKDVTYQIESTLPPALGKPFFIGQPLEQVLGSFSPTGADESYVFLNGTADTTDIYKWHVTGKAAIKNTAYKGVPAYSASTSMDLTRNILKFYDIAVNFNYQDYPLRKQFSAAKEGSLTAAHIHWIQERGHVEINQLKGNHYPAPLLRMFAPSIADHLEDYRFHSPPPLAASGIIDVRNAKETKVTIDMQGCNAMTWQLIGKPSIFKEITTRVTVTNEQVTINPLRCKLFGGDVSANVTVQTGNKNAYVAKAMWKDLLMAEIGKTHQFKDNAYGKLTGKITLKGDNRGQKFLEGDGLCVLEKGELFAVPIFGPLSFLLSSIFEDKKSVGYERAKDAFANFTITKGVLETTDFITQTSNLKFTGNGKIDFDQQTIDMTIRMNARGVMGILTWPLSPLIKGLVQFRGTGPLKKPIWEHVVFTSPPEKEEKELLDTKPLKAKAVEEP